MAPLKRVAKTPEEAKANGLATIHDFFKAAPKKGRRTKNSIGAGRKPKTFQEVNTYKIKAPKSTKAATTLSVDETKRIKIKRKIWSRGENLQKLIKAAEDWKVEQAKDPESRMSLRWFAASKGIPLTTF